MAIKNDDKNQLYRLNRFSQEQLSQFSSNIATYSSGINGMPKNNSEVFTKRGWLLPFLFSYGELLWGRWMYWMAILQKGTIAGSGPIPPD
ncbi:hypothetical protein [Paenibacillus periandrae]|uniref:hypothetical protein n=1 Tax=Paenibacillus periandrae TaxID=1761741 RepID=UPI001F09A497|nr:hypothetical protein [Paenibacillus periandrae]